MNYSLTTYSPDEGVSIIGKKDRIEANQPIKIETLTNLVPRAERL